MKFHVSSNLWGGDWLGNPPRYKKVKVPDPIDLLKDHGIEPHKNEGGQIIIDIDARQLYRLMSDTRVEILIHRYREPRKGWTDEDKKRGLHDHSLLAFDYPGKLFRQR